MAHTVVYHQSIIAYHVYGTGTVPVFCFHGFSLSGTAYEGLGKYCPAGKVLYALDFPYHGATEWHGESLRAEDLLAIFQLILEQEQGGTLVRFELMGHSMGGRICLYLYQCYSSRIDRLVLLAPDGLKLGFWHRFMFRSAIGPSVLKQLSRSSRLVMGLADFSLRCHLINKSLYNLVASAYEDPGMAHLVYLRLMATRHFYPDRKKILENIRQEATPVYLFFGKYDKIIPAVFAASWTQMQLPTLHIAVLLSGHMLLANEANYEAIAKVL